MMKRCVAVVNTPESAAGGRSSLTSQEVAWAAFVTLREQLAGELATEGVDEYLQDRQQPMDGPRDPFATKWM